MNQRRPWLEEEDTLLKELVQNKGLIAWAEIARIMGKHFTTARSGKQCRERYHNHLDARIKQGLWGKQEEQLLVDLQNALGNSWADISRSVAGRSQNTVKNKYFSLLRRGVRVLNQAIRRHLKKYKELEMHRVKQIVDSFDPTLPKEEMTAEYLSRGSIKQRLLFYGLRDQGLPFATEDYADIKRLIDDIRGQKKQIQANCKVEQPVKYEGQWEEIEKDHKEERREPQKKEMKEEGSGSKAAVLGLNKISLQNMGLQFLQDCQKEDQIWGANQFPGMPPIIPNRLSSLSNRSQLSFFQTIEKCPSQLIHKESTFKSFDIPEFDLVKGPFMLLSESPHFQPPKGSFSSWSYLFQH